MKAKVVGMIVVVLISMDIYGQSCVNCNNAVNTGQNSTAIGYNAQSTGDYSLALGFNSFAGSLRSIAIGNQATVNAGAGMAIGNMVSASNLNAFVFGTGCSGTQPLVNSNSNTLMIGFNSNLPTLYVGSSNGPGTFGNIGIGTTNPTERLTVNGTVESKSGGFRFPDGTLQASKAFTPWQQGTSNRIFYQNGDVGIGTQNPVAKLDVYGDIVLGKPGENFIIHSRPWIGDALIIAPQNNNGGWDWSKSITLKDNGQVYIGGDLAFTSPHTSYKLAVNGKVVSKEVIVTIQQWADEVFERDYKLAALPEIEKFISENHHLPGVPSAPEVSIEGLSLGEMNKILLTKVEELTLHAINMQKQIDNLLLMIKNTGEY